MTLEIKFSGVTPAQALKLIMAADAAAEIQTEPQTETAPALAIHAPITTQSEPAVPVQTIPTAAPVQPPVAAVQPPAPPTAVKQYTQDELAVAARPVCELPGGREKLLELLHSFSYTDSTGAVRTVQSIMDMPPEQYPALANGIRQLGGRI